MTVGARAMLLDRNVLAQDLYSMRGICVILPVANRKHELRGIFYISHRVRAISYLRDMFDNLDGNISRRKVELVSLFFTEFI